MVWLLGALAPAQSQAAAGQRGAADFEATVAIAIEPNFSPINFQWTFTDQGRLFFRAFNTTVGGLGLYTSAGPGGFNKILEAGDDAPGLPGDEVVSAISAWSASGNGYAFVGFLTGTGVDTSNDVALFAGTTSGGTRLVFREGDPAPGLPGKTFDFGADQVRANGSGHVVFEVDLDPSGKAVYFDSGSLELVVEANIEELVLNSGSLGIIGFLDGEFGIWGGAPTPIGELARVGDNAPGTTSQYTEFDSVSISQTARFAFAADLTGGSTAVFSGLGGGTRLVREVATSVGDPTTNFAGQVAFVENSGLPSVAVMAETPTLTQIASSGGQAPGLPAGTTFFDFIGRPVINDFRQVAFLSILGGTGVGPANDRSLWIHVPGSGPQLVAREGGTVRIAPADVRTIQALEVLPTGSLRDGTETGFTSTGRLAYKATFSDGNSAILIAELPPAEVVFLDGFESGDVSSWQ